MVTQRPLLIKVMIGIWLLGVLYAYVTYLANDSTCMQKIFSPIAKIAQHLTAYDTH